MVSIASGSDDALALKFTSNGVMPSATSALRMASGGVLGRHRLFGRKM